MKEQLILTETNFSKLKELVKKNKEKVLIFTSNDDELNRKVSEKLPIDILIIPLEERKDYMKQRNSGFNEIMAKILKKNKINLGVSLDELIESKNKERILARLKQNIFLCNKSKIKIEIIETKNNKSPQDKKALLLVLGLHTSLISN
ncbi:hypothetical protein GW932_00040 [archaeon]|nr:hypothetical protein [archaeon]